MKKLTFALLLLLGAMPLAAWSQIDDVIFATCREQGVPFALAEAIPTVESSWNPYAVNPREGSEGLYQLQNYYHRWFVKMFNGGKEFNPFNPFENARVAIRYLGWLHRLLGSWWLALVAYNQGPTVTLRGTYYQSAQVYANRVLRLGGIS